MESAEEATRTCPGGENCLLWDDAKGALLLRVFHPPSVLFSIMPSVSFPTLRVNQPVKASAPDTNLEITLPSGTTLKPGVYQFQLEVTDDSGNNSEPTQFRLIVADDQKPTAVITGPSRVAVNTPFTLSAKNSVDVGGQIKTYTWTLVQAP